MKQPAWITRAVVLAIHDELLAEHGGSEGLRDIGLLESALARPEQAFAYGVTSLEELAARYAYGICKNHAFVDGNKRTALAICDVFLQLNGFELSASEPEAVSTFREVAAGDLKEEDLTNWIRAHSKRT